ncbi:hypothetical protein AK812_SmicGene27856 [Symbiodinium microadriaticum]|uniref:Uncharacterized protein n=1 Tax=Symbiodinium microadriaticum TaxID=2951 RepID=A0A1Q9D5Z3_SYMMI|nr:hypothetical protein AK812_SmicGene27856 [Symbiodinium microadriaticum]CAE7868990.1 unnamed protein product [Symbiodinium microadriaticum]
MPQVAETVLGEAEPEEVLPEVLGRMEDPVPSEFLEACEVSPGVEDHSPPTCSMSLRQDADRDKAGELVQLHIAFVHQMKATRPEILRGVRVWQLLRYLPWAWLRGQLEDLHVLSQETAKLDEFWSHSWRGAGWAKFTNILYLHSCMPASIAGTLSAGLAFGFVSAGFLGALGTYCMLFGFVAFCITLLLWRPHKLVFLDIACIHQTDEERRGEAIMSMGAFLKQSNSMLVLWDPTWVTRLWCVFEIAAFLHSHGRDGEAGLQLVPPLLGPAFLGGQMLIWAATMIYTYIESFFSEGSLLEGEHHLMLVGVVALLLISLVTHALRGYARSVHTLQEQLRVFKAEQTRSACCENGHEDESLCDRVIILESIAAWYNSLDSFELQVQTEVRMAIFDQLAYKAISYQRILVLSTPYLWLRIEQATVHASDPVRQVVNLAQALTYFLAITPLIHKLVFRLCFRLRARCCNFCLDFFVSMAIVIAAFSFYAACYAIQVYVFRQNDRELLRSLISMLSWWAVAAILWRST